MLLAHSRLRLEGAKPFDQVASGIAGLPALLLHAIDPVYAGTLDARERVEVRLRRDPGQHPELVDKFWPWVKRIELHTQDWRWQGRPYSRDFPFSAIASNGRVQAKDDDSLVLWDVQGFLDRELTEVRRVSVDLALYDEQPLLLNEDISGDLRMLYTRYALRIFGRYDFGTARSTETSWIREIVPCRWFKKLDRPAVRMVLPLTAAPDANRDPGVLVVVDETWFATGGLTERLEVAIVRSCEEELRSVDILEFGEDPILSRQPWNKDDDPGLQTPVGPIGYTYDFSGSAMAISPKFRASSFLLRLSGKGEGKAWPFAKLKFRRVLEARGMAKGLDGADDASQQRRQSDWTPARWIQFPPDSTAFPSDMAQPAFDRTSIQQLAWRLESPNLVILKRGAPVTFSSPVAGIGERRRIAALVTRVITDAFGRDNVESFDSLFLQPSASGNRLEFSYGGLLGAPGRYRVRLLEIQISLALNNALKPCELWDSLFPKDETQDATARIVRQSLPIEGRIEAPRK